MMADFEADFMADFEAGKISHWLTNESRSRATTIDFCAIGS
jgi:hypothetical protein